MPDETLKSLYVLVTAHPDGKENLMFANSGKAVVPLVTADPKLLDQFHSLAMAKAMEKGDRIRVLRFDRADAIDIGGPNLEEQS